MKLLSFCHVLIILSIQRSSAHKSYRKLANVFGTSYVVKLNSTTFREEMFNQDHAIILEFYTSISGDIHFASLFNNFCIDIKYWWEIIRCKAIDCSLPESLEICGTFNAEGVLPNLKYILPNYNESAGTGILVSHDLKNADLHYLRELYVYQLQLERYSRENWPILRVLDQEEIIDEIMQLTANSSIRYVVVINDCFHNNTTVSFEVILDLSSVHCIQVFAALSGTQIINIYNNKNQRVAFYPSKHLNRREMFSQIQDFLLEEDIKVTGPAEQSASRK